MLPNVQFELMDAESLCIDRQLFDVIICSEVLEHLHHPEILLSQLYRLLKKDGILIITVPNGRGPRELLVTRPILYFRNRQGRIWNTIQFLKRSLGYQGVTVQSAADNLDHVQFFTRNRLIRIAEQNGFVITRWAKSNFIEDVFPFSFLTKRIPYLQKLDCRLADVLPFACTGGFMMVWKKNLP